MPTRLERWMRSKDSRQHGPDAEEASALGGPVARAAAAVLAPREDEERDALGGIAHGRVVDGHRLAGGLERREGPFSLRERVAQPDVAEGASHHDLVVAAACPVRVELARA